MEKFTVVGHFAILAVAISSLLLVSCIPVPIFSTRPDTLVERPTLDGLVGKHKEAVLAALGPPNVELTSEKASYFIYGGWGDEYQVLFFLHLPIGAQKSEHGKRYCVLLEFDEQQVFRRHSQEESSRVWHGGEISDCPWLFFDADALKRFRVATMVDYIQARKTERDQLEARLNEGDHSYELKVELARRGLTGPLAELAWGGNAVAAINLYDSSGIWGPLKKLSDEGNPRAAAMLAESSQDDLKDSIIAYENILEQAKLGATDAQLRLYYDHNTYNPLSWLCKSADAGNPKARYRLALLYELGSNGVPQSNEKARLWYRLATESGYAWGDAYAERVEATAEELQNSETLLHQWQPGWCATDLRLNLKE